MLFPSEKITQRLNTNFFILIKQQIKTEMMKRKLVWKSKIKLRDISTLLFTPPSPFPPFCWKEEVDNFHLQANEFRVVIRKKFYTLEL